MECESVFNNIDSMNEKHLDILEDFCNIESPTDFKEGVDKAGEFILNLAKENVKRITSRVNVDGCRCVA